MWAGDAMGVSVWKRGQKNAGGASMKRPSGAIYESSTPVARWRAGPPLTCLRKHEVNAKITYIAPFQGPIATTRYINLSNGLDFSKHSE